MAKRVKKWMSMVMVLSMLVSMTRISVAAESVEPPATVIVTTEITDENGNVIGTMTTETTSTETDTASEYGNIIDITKDWSTQQTEGTAGAPETHGDTTTQVDHTVITDVTGSEQETDTIHTDKTTGHQTYSGHVEGTETTIVTDTTTTTTTTENDLQSDETTDPITTVDGEVEEGQWSEMEKTQEGQWVSGAGDEQGEFEKVTGTEESTSETLGIDLDTDPLDNGDVTLKLKPGSTDEEELYITIEDALANDITYREGTQSDGSVVTYIRDSKGNVVGYKILRKTLKTGTPGEIEDGTPSTPQQQGETIKTYIRPEGYTPGTVTSADGSTITVTEEILDESGNVIGYRIVETTTQTVPTTSAASAETPASAPSQRTLPQRPEAPEPVTENGITTTVTVTDILENDQVIGYKTTTTLTDEEGNEISSESSSIYGTVTSYSSTVEKKPETDVITTTKTTTVYGILSTRNFTVTTPGTRETENIRDVSEEIYQLVQTENGLFFLYQGKMYAVTAIGTHGQIEMGSVQPDVSGLTPGSYDGYVSQNTLLRNPGEFSLSNNMRGIADGYELEYVGYGLETAIRVDKNYKTGAGQVLAHQFKLKDRDGNYHYVLCADLGTNAVRGADYNMTNVASANYYVRDGAAEMIEAIALSGYWGTESGIGSLANVKAFLKEHSGLSDAQINALKPGEALAATQAAIWFFGNSDESKAMADDAVTGKIYNSDGTTRSATADEAVRVNALYTALIGLDPDTVINNTTEFLNKDNFATETTLTIREKATDSSGNGKTDAHGNEVYVADLTFSLDVEKSNLTGNLNIKVTDQYGNVLHSAALKTDSSNLVGRVLADGSAGSTYTIPDLELAEGVKITLNLSGTQELAEGVYLYSAAVYSTSQTFVGIAAGERDVNLSVDMQFTVTDPEAQVKHTTTTWTEEQVNRSNYTRTDHYSAEKLGTETTQTIVTNTKTYGTTITTGIVTRISESRRDWRGSYEYTLVVVNDEDGGQDKDGGQNEAGEVGEVIRAEAPKTGDITLTMAAVSLFSAGGLLFLNRKRDED